MKLLTMLLATSFGLLINLFTGADMRTISGRVNASDDQRALAGVLVQVKGTKTITRTNEKGNYKISVPDENDVLVFSLAGFKTKEIKVGDSNTLNITMEKAVKTAYELSESYKMKHKVPLPNRIAQMVTPISGGDHQFKSSEQLQFNTESYNAINENRFLEAKQNPLSTFGIDVDAASYSNIRRFINDGRLPPKDAVRIEEMINYFDYDYPEPLNGNIIGISTEVAEAPWNPQHHLVKIGLQAPNILANGARGLPASNLVFLIDVSGSMNEPNKLPLVQSSMRMLVDQLREEDNVAIVVYAGAAGVVLPATPGSQKQKIKEAIYNLQAGGSTAGGAGIKLAYKLAADQFIKNGNNRVILATDGDFNTGASSDAEMQRLIEEKRQTGIYLTVLGYGMGNYKDSKMETLADKGNGNYAYIDNISEAKKTLVTEFGGTLFTIAKDVKLQVEFNPVKAGAYRLIGYENRMLNKEDFNNDKKDAGDLGSGHTVTALYEVIPAGVKSKFLENVDELKYQKPAEEKDQSTSNELLTIKLRYKKPGEETSRLMSKAVTDQAVSWDDASDNFRFASAVAAYGMILRDSEFKQNATYATVINWAANARGEDHEGYRAEFIRLVKASSLMAKDLLSLKDKMIMAPSH